MPMPPLTFPIGTFTGLLRRALLPMLLLALTHCGSDTSPGTDDGSGGGDDGADGDFSGDGDGDGDADGADLDAGVPDDDSADADGEEPDAGAPDAATPPGPFALTSSELAEGEDFPEKYTCEGDGQAGHDPSPPLSWGPGELSPQSYAIVFLDTDNGWTHWVMWDIPADVTALEEGLGEGYELDHPAGAKQAGGNDLDQYFGPCPQGNRHLYEFTLYALDVATLPDVDEGSDPDDVIEALESHAIDTTTLERYSDAATN
jgi:Raf kinase inhibitor-like YbhB/YbcL family protein